MSAPGAGPSRSELVGHLRQADPIGSHASDAAAQQRPVEEGHPHDFSGGDTTHQLHEARVPVGLVQQLSGLLFVFHALSGHEFGRDRIEIVHP